MNLQRCIYNPLISPQNVQPSRSDFEVLGIFNCGAVQLGDETILLCRVSECVRNTDPDILQVPVIRHGADGKDRLETRSFRRSDPAYDFSDPRTVRRASDGQVAALTSLSHLRVARARDGIHFAVDGAPAIMPDSVYEAWGMEDPRITCIDGHCYVTYSSVAPFGVSESLLVTDDFLKFERKGVIFAPENKDVTVFPARIGGLYYALNRPVPSGIGQPNIWLASSPDLLHWGEQKLFCTVAQTDAWDGGRVGGGAVPILTPEGWLVIYHAADKKERYCLGAFLLKADDPSVVLGRLCRPLLEPQTEYEKNGFFGNVVFTCGAVCAGDELRIYYGAADDKICRADVSLAELLRELKH